MQRLNMDPTVLEHLKNKYFPDELGDEALESAQRSETLAGIGGRVGAAIAGVAPQESSLKGGADNIIQRRKGLLQEMEASRDITRAEREDEAYAQSQEEKSPDNDRLGVYKDLLTKMGLDPSSLEGMTLEDVKGIGGIGQFMASQKSKKYEIDSKNEQEANKLKGKKAETARKVTENNNVLYVPGFGQARTKEDAQAIKTESAGILTATSGIDELISLSKVRNRSLSPTERGKSQTIAQLLKGALRLPIVGPGALSEKELELLDSIVANPTNIVQLDSVTAGRLSTLRSTLLKGLQAKARARGVIMSEDESLETLAGIPRQGRGGQEALAENQSGGAPSRDDRDNQAIKAAYAKLETDPTHSGALGVLKMHNLMAPGPPENERRMKAGIMGGRRL